MNSLQCYVGQKCLSSEKYVDECVTELAKEECPSMSGLRPACLSTEAKLTGDGKFKIIILNLIAQKLTSLNKFNL